MQEIATHGGRPGTGWRDLAAVALVTITLAGTAHNMLVSGRADTASLHPLSALGYATLALGYRSGAARGTTGRIIALVHSAIILVSLQRLCETFLPAWPTALNAQVLLDTKEALGFHGSFSVETAFALVLLHGALLAQRLDTRISLALTVATWGAATMLLLQTLVGLGHWQPDFSDFSLACTLVATAIQTWLLREMPLLRPVFSRRNHGRIVRRLLLGALLIPWLSGYVYFNLTQIDAGNHYALEVVFGVIGWSMMALVLFTGNLIEKAADAMSFAAEHDFLTGIKNRNGMSRAVTRGSHGAGVVMFDIDNFKKLNDRFGHEAGDHALQAVADCIKPLLRKSDLMARWGGEEFLVVADCADETDLAELAERLRARIEAKVGPSLAPLHHKVTASFGASIMEPGETGLDPVIERADAALYRAKSLGRNRVCAWSQLRGATGQTCAV